MCLRAQARGGSAEAVWGGRQLPTHDCDVVGPGAGLFAQDGGDAVGGEEDSGEGYYVFTMYVARIRMFCRRAHYYL